MYSCTDNVIKQNEDRGEGRGTSHFKHHESGTVGDSKSEQIDVLSTLYQEYDYPHELKTDSDWFPFDSQADALIYLWDVPGKSHRLPQARLTLLLQTLPLLGVTGLSCSSGQYFREKYDARIPLMKTHSVWAHKSIRHRQKTNKKKHSDANVEEVSFAQRSRVSVPFFCPDEFIIRTMADPLWSRTLRFGLDKLSTSGKITQFNQTPYAAEILRWSQLMQIDRWYHDDSAPVMVGHWYEYKADNDKLSYALVQKLFYNGGSIDIKDTNTDDWWPNLWAKVRVSQVERSKKKTIKKYQRLTYDRDTWEVPVQDLHLQPDKPIFRGNWSTFQKLTKSERQTYYAYLRKWPDEHIPVEPTFQYPEVIQGKPFFYLSWLMDSFKATKSGKQSDHSECR